MTEGINRCETEGCLNIGVRYAGDAMKWLCVTCAYLADKSVEPKEDDG